MLSTIMSSRIQRQPRSWKLGRFFAFVSLLAVFLLAPALAIGGPRSGGSFGGRIGFRSSGGLGAPRTSSYGYHGGGSSFTYVPSFGWGWHPGWGFGGYGYGGGFGLPSVLVLAGLGVGAFLLVRALRRSQMDGRPGMWGSGSGDLDEDDASATSLSRAYVYRLQLGLGRVARGIQTRLAEIAEAGDAETEAGLAALLQQTALELLREKDSIRYAGGAEAGPLSLTNAESQLNGWALNERARFQVERVRGAGPQMRRSSVAAEEGREALELVLVTVVVATRAPVGDWKNLDDHAAVETLLHRLGEIGPDGLLGLEIVWTPADPDDSMTEMDLMTTYPELRRL
jgi:uncharacterized membrane protein